MKQHTAANESAFPRPYSEEQPGDYVEPCYAQAGLSMREWWAGQALVGMMANSDLPTLMKSGWAPSTAAAICFLVADAMIAESAKNPSPQPKE